MSLSIRLARICTEIAGEFPGWGFSSDNFKNKTLKHTDFLARPFLGFKTGMVAVSPIAAIANKRTLKLAKKILGRNEHFISVILFSRQLENIVARRLLERFGARGLLLLMPMALTAVHKIGP